MDENRFEQSQQNNLPKETLESEVSVDSESALDDSINDKAENIRNELEADKSESELPGKDAPEQKAEKESGELKIDRTRLENILESARGLVSVLREREDEGFGQLIKEGELSLLRAALREGEEMLGREVIAQNKFEDMIMKMTRAIEEIGNTPQRRDARDSTDSLQKVVSRIRRMSDDVHEMGVSVAKTEGRSELTLSLIKRLKGVLNDKQLFVKKLQGRLSEYMGR